MTNLSCAHAHPPAFVFASALRLAPKQLSFPAASWEEGSNWVGWGLNSKKYLFLRPPLFFLQGSFSVSPGRRVFWGCWGPSHSKVSNSNWFLIHFNENGIGASSQTNQGLSWRSEVQRNRQAPPASTWWRSRWWRSWSARCREPPAWDSTSTNRLQGFISGLGDNLNQGSLKI